MTDGSWLDVTATGIALMLYVQPGAAKAGPAGLFDGIPKVRIRSRAREGAANRELVRLLAKALGVPASRVRIASGSRSRRKRVLVEGQGASLASRARELLG
jgi:uncharacterized protein (TIGR00251 family)